MKTKRLLKYLDSNLDNVEIIKDLAVLKPTEHIVRGFLLDRSSEKGAYYLYRLVVPLFSPVMPNLSLNYSERLTLNDAKPIVVRLNDEADTFSSEVLGKIKDECSFVLKNLSSPNGFIAYCKGKDLERINMKLELAIAYCLAGESAVGRRLLEDILSAQMPNNPYFHGVLQHAGNVLNSLETGSEVFNNLVRSYEDNNVSVLFPKLTREKTGVIEKTENWGQN